MVGMADFSRTPCTRTAWNTRLSMSHSLGTSGSRVNPFGCDSRIPRARGQPPPERLIGEWILRSGQRLLATPSTRGLGERELTLENVELAIIPKFKCDCFHFPIILFKRNTGIDLHIKITNAPPNTRVLKRDRKSVLFPFLHLLFIIHVPIHWPMDECDLDDIIFINPYPNNNQNYQGGIWWYYQMGLAFDSPHLV